MLEYRNLLSHTYDETVFEEAVKKMADRYVQGFDELYRFLKAKSSK